MRFLSVRDLRNNSAQVWKELAREKEMIVTHNGRPVALLAAVDEGNVEQTLTAWRQARATQAIASIQQASMHKETDRIRMEEIDAEIGKVRKERRKQRG